MMGPCIVCGSDNFDLFDGYRFCCICQTQSQESVEQLVDSSHFMTETREILIKKPNQRRRRSSVVFEETQLAKFEASNRLLALQVKALIANCPELPKDFKSIVLGVWMHYLEKCEVAFFDCSTRIQLEELCESDEESSTSSTALTKTFAILYIAIRICGGDIYISDFVHWATQGHLPSVIAPFSFSTEEQDILDWSTIPDETSILRNAGCISSTLTGRCRFPEPDLMSLLKRYIVDLNLPLDILRMVEDNPVAVKSLISYASQPLHQCPRYELFVLSFLLVILRKLFGLDGVTEKLLSDHIDESGDREAFDWDDWENWTRIRIHVIQDNYCPMFGQFVDMNRDVGAVCEYYDRAADKCDPSYHCEVRKTMKGTFSSTDTCHRPSPSCNQLELPIMSKHLLTEATNYAKSRIYDPDDTLKSFLSIDFTNKTLRHVQSSEDCPANAFDYVSLDLAGRDLRETKYRLKLLPEPIKMVMVLMSWLANECPSAFVPLISQVEGELFWSHCGDKKKIRCEQVALEK